MSNFLKDIGNNIADIGKKAVHDAVTEVTSAVITTVATEVVKAVIPHEEKTGVPLPPALDNKEEDKK